MGNGGAGSSKVGEAYVELGVRSRVKKDMADAEKEARSGAQKVGEAIADVGKKKPAIVSVKPKMDEKGKDDLKDGLSDIANQFARFGMGLFRAGVFVSGAYFVGKQFRELTLRGETFENTLLRIRAAFGIAGRQGSVEFGKLATALEEVRMDYKGFSREELVKGMAVGIIEQRQPITDYTSFAKAMIGYSKQYNLTLDESARRLAMIRQHGKAWDALKVPISENVSSLEQYNAAIRTGMALFDVELAIEGRKWGIRKVRKATGAMLEETLMAIAGGWRQLTGAGVTEQLLNDIDVAARGAAKDIYGKTPEQQRRRQGMGNIPGAGVLSDQEINESMGPRANGSVSRGLSNRSNVPNWPGIGEAEYPSMSPLGTPWTLGGGMDLSLQNNMDSLNSTMRELIDATRDQVRSVPQQQKDSEKFMPADLSLLLD